MLGVCVVPVFYYYYFFLFWEKQCVWDDNDYWTTTTPKMSNKHNFCYIMGKHTMASLKSCCCPSEPPSAALSSKGMALILTAMFPLIVPLWTVRVEVTQLAHIDLPSPSAVIAAPESDVLRGSWVEKDKRESETLITETVPLTEPRFKSLKGQNGDKAEFQSH